MMINTKIEVQQTDITKIQIESIVNAANSSLRGGGGVDGAIHRAAGPKMHEECMRIIGKMGSCPPGEAVITSGGNMPAKYVIHTVGPVWNGGNYGEEEILAKAYRSSLELAVEFGIKSIAFPNISTGIYGFPKEKAAEIAVTTVNDFLSSDDFVQKVVFVCFEDDNFALYKELIQKL